MTPAEINALYRVTIPALHEVYCQLVTRLTLDTTRTGAWEHWIAFRQHEPFTAADLQTVVAYIRRKIDKGERRQESLHFRTLIGDPGRFEEDLQDAKGSVHRVTHVSAKDRALMATGRPAEDRGHTAQSAAEIIEQHKLATTKWSEWKKNNPLFE